jgi:predicted alpha-1,2-mannosidase
MIGALGWGNALPGPTVPHGMVKLGPDTHGNQDNVDSYEYASDRIEGFTHTHLEGPGGSGNGYSQILLMPYVGAPAADKLAWSSTYRHQTEDAAPGYYAVTLDDWGIRAELTSTRRVGLHRYTFPATSEARVVIDLRQCRGVPLGGSLDVVGDDVVEGTGIYQMSPIVALALDDIEPGTGVTTIHFSAKFSRPFAGSEVFQSGVSQAVRLDWETTEGEAIEARVGISYISVEQARENRVAETEDQTFEQVRQASVDAWNRLLWRVEVEGGTDDQRTMFYTALFRSFFQPADYTEDGRFWSGASGEGVVYPADGWRYYTDNWCIWDTAKTTHPLLTILEPEVVGDMVQSLVHTYEAGGWMQKCTWNAVGDPRIMIANNQFCVVADAYIKGIRNFDADTAMEGMKFGSMNDSPDPFDEGGCGWLERGTPRDYIDLGYVSYECDQTQSASMTLEHAYNDWCVAQMAQAMGNDDDATFYRQRSGNWRNLFNPEHGFSQRKHRDGRWVEPFDPAKYEAGFTEADSWKYTWFVPHDVCGLMDAMGGPEAFNAKLDTFFDDGHFAPDNEPDFHVPYLYGFSGALHRTADRVNGHILTAFSAEPGGLPGNDDAGATSAWLAFTMLGLYPVAPGEKWYWLGTPSFPKTTLHIDPQRRAGVDFVTEARNLSPDARYIQSATLNGVPLDIPRLSHADIVAGGSLVLQMSDTPGEWGRSIPCPLP